MSIIPAKMEQAADNMDRTRALVIGIFSGIAAFFALWKIFWAVFAAATLSSFGYSPVWLILTVLWWGAIAALGVGWSVVFLRRYSSQP